MTPFIQNVLRAAAIVLSLALAPMAQANSYVTTGKVGLTRGHTSKVQGNGVQGVTAFKLNVAFEGRCQWLILEANDIVTLAHLLSAKNKDRTVTVYYDDERAVPWGDTASCYVTAIDH
ncbi:hypothetical protein [Roseateles chitinivorans]|uniref:hypothetical protein n=1 Tax=Roseateles chitinivorans TaxID=2917965 RepID=UPI003D667B08